MQGIQIEQLEDDTTLHGIGTLFRRIDGSAWGINIGLFPRQDARSLRFSTAPILARKRLYNQKSKSPPGGWKDSFISANLAHWETCTIADCPAYQNKYDRGQYCFKIQLENERTIFIPQFELARALFLHDGYLAKTSLELNQLDMEFDVQVDKDKSKAEIHVMPFSNYPLKSLNEPDARSILSWILINDEARQSFNSIAKNQLKHGMETNGYRRWDFRFDPPPVKGAEFILRGIFDQETQSMFVFEIIGIKNITVELPELVEFYHPDFKEYVRGNGQGGAGPSVEPPEDHNVHDGEDASGNNEQIILRPPVVSFEFNKPFRTIRKPEKKHPRPSGRKNDDELGEQDGGDVSVEEANAAGRLPGADFDAVENVTDNSAIYANKFDCFKKMLDLLVSKHGCQVSVALRKLKRRGRSKKHILSTTGESRCLLDVTIKKNGSVYHALELDMSDDGKYLSTILLKLPSEEHWPVQVDSIEAELQRLGLRWPTKTLKKFCGRGNYNCIPHPETKSTHKGNLDPASVEHWATRFFSWIN